MFIIVYTVYKNTSDFLNTKLYKFINLSRYFLN